MSRELGNALPAALLSLLEGRDLSSRLGRVIVVATVDAAGWPHPALLSYGEVVAVDARKVRLATYANSRTAGNLRRFGRLTLCLIESGMAYYLKASARELAEAPELAGLARFEALVEQVLVDQAREELEPGARLARGIEFEDGRPPSELLAAWTTALRALRG